MWSSSINLNIRSLSFNLKKSTASPKSLASSSLHSSLARRGPLIPRPGLLFVYVFVIHNATSNGWLSLAGAKCEESQVIQSSAGGGSWRYPGTRIQNFCSYYAIKVQISLITGITASIEDDKSIANPNQLNLRLRSREGFVIQGQRRSWRNNFKVLLMAYLTSWI